MGRTQSSKGEHSFDEIFPRLMEAREYRHYKQRECGQWFNVSEASYGRKERGIEGGLGPREIKRLLKELRVDARWLFGQIEGTIQDADLDRAPESSLAGEVLRKEALRLEKARGKTVDDPLAARVANDAVLRKIVERIAYLDRISLQRMDAKFDAVRDLLDIGLVSGSKESGGGA